MGAPSCLAAATGPLFFSGQTPADTSALLETDYKVLNGNKMFLLESEIQRGEETEISLFI